MLTRGEEKVINGSELTKVSHTVYTGGFLSIPQGHEIARERILRKEVLQVVSSNKGEKER